MRTIYVFLILFLIIFSSCTAYYEYAGLITVKNNTDIDVKVDIYFKKNIYYQDGQTKDYRKHIEMTITAGDSESKIVLWAQAYKTIYNETESGDIHVTAVKLLEPTKIILDKEYNIIDRDKFTVYVEKTD